MEKTISSLLYGGSTLLGMSTSVTSLHLYQFVMQLSHNQFLQPSHQLIALACFSDRPL